MISARSKRRPSLGMEARSRRHLILTLRPCAYYTHGVSKRLQVIMNDSEMRRIRSLARSKGVTVSELTRRALLEIAQRESVGNVELKLQSVRSAVTHAFPTSDIAQMNAEIVKGYGA